MTQVSDNNPIAQLNDRLRTTFFGGQMAVTLGIQSLPEELQRAVLNSVQAFNIFNEDNDPYGEHDFGTFSCQGHQINWKIDYYDLEMLYRSEDPADPAKTKRVLTIMLAEEY